VGDENAQQSDVVSSDIPDSDRLSIIFSYVNHITFRGYLNPVEKFTNCEWLAGKLIVQPGCLGMQAGDKEILLVCPSTECL